MFLFFQSFYNFTVFLILSDSITFVDILNFYRINTFTDLINFINITFFVIIDFYVFLYFYFLYFCSFFIIIFSLLFTFYKSGASEWSCRVALDSKSRHRQLAPFFAPRLELVRNVARHAISKVCNCVLPHSTLPHSGSEVSGLLSQLWTCSFREPLSLLGVSFLKIL